MASDGPQEPCIDLDGALIPVSMAAKAVRRCIAGIQAIDFILQEQGFASEDDLREVRNHLTGEAQ